MAVARLFTESLALLSASSVLITSVCSALISTPMYCAAWPRAASIADSFPSSSDEAPSFAPEKYKVCESDVVRVSQAGGLGADDVLIAAGLLSPHAVISSARPSA